jgi:hypothetical protein
MMASLKSKMVHKGKQIKVQVPSGVSKVKVKATMKDDPPLR